MGVLGGRATSESSVSVPPAEGKLLIDEERLLSASEGKVARDPMDEVGEEDLLDDDNSDECLGDPQDDAFRTMMERIAAELESLDNETPRVLNL